jgi:hypothetical protein
MPAKPKARPRSVKVVNASRTEARPMEEQFVFRSVPSTSGWPSIEISSESGVIKICKAGEGQKKVPLGSVMVMQMLGRRGVAMSEKHIPIETFCWNLAQLKHSPEYVYWMHHTDFNHVFRRLFGDHRARHRTEASQRTHQRGA